MPGDEVADRAVGAHAQPARGERVLEVVAEAAQDLELEVAVVAAERAVGGDGVRDRAQVVATRSPTRTCGARLEQAERQRLEVAVASRP